ncbi:MULTISPECIES: hypothetical protein [unclassified Mesorhizobium]|uniref:hypothetical protein n=1 Tax=unclassified Mesorhizobium TaxID=325217 RepID=UPI0003F70D7F|nr:MULTISPECIES: hypothetical protein [unclassified Mesorhizobium]WJI83505.1 hypothetical protein NLY34_12525 [Mesorhizobium sp. C374B]WJI90029.1 hypothetical protein NLY42_14920 [Mesorhizobium sp. C372A]
MQGAASVVDALKPRACFEQRRQHDVQLAHGDDQPGATGGRIDRKRLAEQRPGAFGRSEVCRRNTVSMIASLPPISTKDTPLSIRRGIMSVNC